MVVEGVDLADITNLKFYIAKVRAVAGSKNNSNNEKAKKILAALKILYPEEFI